MTRAIAAAVIAAMAVLGLTGCGIHRPQCPGTVASCVSGWNR